GMYDPNNLLPPLQIASVDTTGATHARLILNAYFNTVTHAADTTWGLQFRLNGGAWRTHTLTAAEVAVINNQPNPSAPGSNGNITLSMDLPLTDIKNGTNTLEVLPINAPMDYPPVIANIDLLLTSL